MPFTATTATKKVLTAKKRIRLLAGGTSASKTISILLYLIDRAQSDKTPTLTSVVSQSVPHLKRGAIRDFLNIMQEHNYFNDDLWNKSESTYSFETGSQLEFFSSDIPSKVRGPRRHRLFVNEANNVDKESWDQLLLRTSDFAFADWNPTSDFYMYDDYGLQDDPQASSTDPDVDFLIMTYKDNEALSPSIVQEIEKRQHNRSWWRVYGEGRRGEVEGKIFVGWKIVSDIPHEARLVRRGLDFGYSNDPSVLADIYYYNGGYIADEVLYRKGMHNKDIADLINSQPNPTILTIADSAEPKSIDELRNYGCSVTGVIKRPGYVQRGSENSDIDWVQSQRMSITSRSTNLIKSYNNFMWETDREGKILNTYDHFWSDGMMAIIYAMTSLHQPDEDDLVETKTPSTSLIY